MLAYESKCYNKAIPTEWAEMVSNKRIIQLIPMTEYKKKLRKFHLFGHTCITYQMNGVAERSRPMLGIIDDCNWKGTSHKQWCDGMSKWCESILNEQTAKHKQ